MVGVLGSNPSVDTGFKWLYFSHLFSFHNSDEKVFLVFCRPAGTMQLYGMRYSANPEK
jgi:hypothetical protein